MEQNELISALIAFLLGLLAKFIYDIWSERRKKKSLFITKTTVNSFTLGNLEKEIRNQIEVTYKNHPIKSVQIVRVDVENNGFSAAKNQSISVRFGSEAKIIGEPKSESSSEDLRYVDYDPIISPNSRRILVKLLRKGTRLSWNFTVINHTQNDFIVEHGVASLDKDVTDSDLDVSSAISNEKISLDVVSRIRRILVYIVLIKISMLFRDSFTFGMQELSRPVMNVLIIWMWFLVIQEINRGIVPFVEWVKEFTNPQKTIEINNASLSEGSNIMISTDQGDTKPSITKLELDKKILQELLEKSDTKKSLPKKTSRAKK